jgi:hypothetical protein
MAAQRINTGTVAVKAPRPVWDRKSGWRVVEGRVAADSPEAAASFAADIVASLAARRTGEAMRAELGWLPLSNVHHSGVLPGHDDDREGPTLAECDWRGTSCVLTLAPVAAPEPPRRTSTVAKVAPRPKPAPSPRSDDMSPCERCGRSDWRTSAGRAWHVANNLDCEKYRKPGRHQYAA